MQTGSGRIEFDPQDIDAILDQIAEKADREYQRISMAECGLFEPPTEAEVKWAEKVLKSARVSE